VWGGIAGPAFHIITVIFTCISHRRFLNFLFVSSITVSHGEFCLLGFVTL
jgi:hypothetical protein